MKANKAITLIALVVTIVVLLILAGVSISMLTGDNGIIKQAQKTKNDTTISNKKEQIKIAYSAAKINKLGEKINENDLQTELDNSLGENKTEILVAEETIVVKFKENNRCYEIDESGNVEGPKELVEDSYAGDLSKNGTCDGTEEKPFKINCIEDLVTFSIMVNGGNEELEIASNGFGGKHVILMRTLNFKSIFSYNDYTATKYGDLNGDGTVDNIMMELTKTEEGCTGFTPIGNETNSKSFGGTFNGNNNEIQNIYINTSENAGLFGLVAWGTIKNLGITGNITSSEGYAAGIVPRGLSDFYNCYNKANINGKSQAGGICGNMWAQAMTIENCYNLGDISSKGNIVGGISGGCAGQIIDCYNFGNISGEGYTSGIVGSSVNDLTITNCYNKGDIESGGWRAAGIIPFVHSNTIVNNCYNIGNIKVKDRYTSYSDAIGIGGTTVTNCYNIGKLATKSSKCFIITDQIIKNSYYYSNLAANGEIIGEGTIDVEGKTQEEFVELLNSYTDDTGVYPEGWKKWKVGENRYPVFSD